MTAAATQLLSSSFPLHSYSLPYPALYTQTYFILSYYIELSSPSPALYNSLSSPLLFSYSFPRLIQFSLMSSFLNSFLLLFSSISTLHLPLHHPHPPTPKQLSHRWMNCVWILKCYKNWNKFPYNQQTVIYESSSLVESALMFMSSSWPEGKRREWKEGNRMRKGKEKRKGGK